MSHDDTLRLVGTVVAEKYRVDSLVAEGGFALLYKATHLVWQRPVALKVFKALGEVSKANKEELLASFIREGVLLADLSERCASICQARDVGMLQTPSGESIPYMVLEWLEGQSLEAMLKADKAERRAPRSLDETMQLLGPIGEALALAHTRGVVHRDVKPANIFLLGDPSLPGCSVKLLDFGIAKVVMDAQKADGAFASTTGKLTSFTPSYAAPEQFSRSHGATGPWTDTFALALVVIECFTGESPLGADDFLQIAYTATNPRQRPTPRTLGAKVSDEVEAVFERALAVAPPARYATVGEFWNALRAAMGQAPMSIALTGPTKLGTPTPPPGALRLTPGVKISGIGNQAPVPFPLSMAPPPPAAGPDRRVAIALSAFGSLATLGVLAWFGLSALGHLGSGRHLGSGTATAPSASASAASTAASTASAVPQAPPPPAPVCPSEMVLVPGGQFFMGSDEGTTREKPAHNVKLSPFCIDIYEVSVAKYVACSDQGKCKRAGRTNQWEGITASDRKTYDPLCNATESDGRAVHPINCVDWERAETYCKGMVPHGRLPSEAEWEFAARGSDGRLYPWGDEAPSAKYLNACGSECVAWGKAHGVAVTAMYKANDGWPNTAPVGSFPSGKSRFGLMDVVGNVWEWVGDWYGPYSDAPSTDPRGPETGTGRVMRGGAWNGSDPSWVRPSFRYMNDPASSSYGVGFRCAADPG